MEKYLTMSVADVVSYYLKINPREYSKFSRIGNFVAPLVFESAGPGFSEDDVIVHVSSVSSYSPPEMFYQFVEPVASDVRNTFLTVVGSNRMVYRMLKHDLSKPEIYVGTTFEYFDFLTHEIADLHLYPNSVSTLRNVFDKTVPSDFYSNGIDIVVLPILRDGSLLLISKETTRKYVGNVLPVVTKFFAGENLRFLVRQSIRRDVGNININELGFAGIGYNYVLMRKPTMFFYAVLDTTPRELASRRGYMPPVNFLTVPIPVPREIRSRGDVIDVRANIIRGIEQYSPVIFNTIDLTHYTINAVAALYQHLRSI